LSNRRLNYIIMNQLRKLTYLALLLILVSCKYEVEVPPVEFEHKLVVIAELEADVAPELIVSTTYAIDSDPLTIPNYASVEVYDTDNPTEVNSFRPPTKQNSFAWSPPGTFVPRVGKEYQLVVDVNDSDMDIEPLIAYTKIPVPGDIVSSEAVTYNQSSDLTRFQIDMTLEDPEEETSNYHLIPMLVDGQDTFSLEIAKVTEGVNASFPLSHRDGMLIDISSLDDNNTLTFEAKTLSPVNVDQMQNPRMVYILKTVTEEYFYYHQTISRSNNSNLGPFTLPVITYSQFIDKNTGEPYGYGVYSAVSKVIRSVEVIK